MNDSSDSQDMVLADTRSIVPTPKGVVNEKAVAIETQATELVSRALSGEDVQGLHDQLRNLGLKAETQANQSIALLEPRVATALQGIRDGEVTGLERLPKFRAKMDELNPHKLSQPRWYDSILSIVGLSNHPATRALKAIAYRYESVQDQIDRMLDDFLELGEDCLRDNIELEKLVNELNEAQVGVLQNAFLAEVLIVKLREAFDQNADNPEVQQQLMKLLFVTSVRARDLRTLETASEVLLDSSSIARDTNFAVYENVRRAAGLARKVLAVGISVAIALHRQKKTMEATRELQDYIEKVLVETSKQANAQAIEAAKMLSEPLLGIEKLQAVFDESDMAFAEVGRIQYETIQSAAEQSKTLAEMAEKSRKRRDGIALPAGANLASIEA